MKDPILWYFADPMCSWCWGFAPSIDTLREDYRGRLKVALILGGLRPGLRDAMTPERRTELLQHWQAVEEKTGQSFRYDGALPDSLIYDTEPASRAVIAVSELDPAATFAMFKAIQSAFYTEARDVTHTDVLASLASDLGVEAQAFLTTFESDAVRAKTLAHFQMARQLGVRGFPTLVLQNPAGHRMLCDGWRPLDELRGEIDAWLDSSPPDAGKTAPS